MGKIYRQLVFEIDKLREIVKENGLKESCFNELSAIKNAIPAKEINKGKILRLWKKIFSSDKMIQPDNLGLFFELGQRYMKVQQSVCEDLNMRLLALESNDITENEEMVSLLNSLEDKIYYPEKYIDFNDIMSLLDLSDDKKLLKQYVDVLGNILANDDKSKRSERTIYEQLFYQGDGIFDHIEREIDNQQAYYKERFDSLAEIENKYKELLIEKYDDFIGQVVSKEIIEFFNTTVIEQWNQMWGQKAGYHELVKQKDMYTPSRGDIEGKMNIQTLPVFPVNNSEWMEYSEEYIACIENNLKKAWADYTRDYVKACAAVCLNQEKEAIIQKKKELLATGERLKQKIASWRELLITISSEQDTWSKELEKLYVKITNSASKTSDSMKKGKAGRVIKKSVIPVILVVIVMGIAYNIKRSSDFITENTEDQKRIKDRETGMSETLAKALPESTSETLSDTSSGVLLEILSDPQSETPTEGLSSETTENLEKPKDKKETKFNDMKKEENYLYILPEVSSRYLSEKDLDGLDQEILRLARNEVFARHGRLFQSEDLKEYFSKQSWYHGYLLEDEFDDSVLNSYEKYNLDLIKTIESRMVEMRNDKEKQMYILPDSSSKYLSKEDLKGLDKSMLRLARNEIFARHGRLFQSKDLSRYFSNQSWYHGYISADQFSNSVLNEYENYNLELIKSLENQ